MKAFPPPCLKRCTGQRSGEARSAAHWAHAAPYRHNADGCFCSTHPPKETGSLSWTFLLPEKGRLLIRKPHSPPSTRAHCSHLTFSFRSHSPLGARLVALSLSPQGWDRLHAGILTGKEVDDVTLLTVVGFREEVNNFATPWVPPPESPFGPPGGATRVSFWETGGFFTAELGTGRLVDCPVEGGCMLGSRVPEAELCTGVPPEEELPEETPCLETEPANGLFL